MDYMRTRSMYIGKEHSLFPYAEKVTALANNLSNAIRFRQRQVFTAVSIKICRRNLLTLVR